MDGILIWCQVQRINWWLIWQWCLIDENRSLKWTYRFIKNWWAIKLVTFSSKQPREHFSSPVSWLNIFSIELNRNKERERASRVQNAIYIPLNILQCSFNSDNILLMSISFCMQIQLRDKKIVLCDEKYARELYFLVIFNRKF